MGQKAQSVTTVVKGHHWQLAPFDRSHMTSY